jgi:hypothetical protein
MDLARLLPREVDGVPLAIVEVEGGDLPTDDSLTQLLVVSGAAGRTSRIALAENRAVLSLAVAAYAVVGVCGKDLLAMLAAYLLGTPGRSLRIESTVDGDVIWIEPDEESGWHDALHRVDDAVLVVRSADGPTARAAIDAALAHAHAEVISP